MDEILEIKIVGENGREWSRRRGPHESAAHLFESAGRICIDTHKNDVETIEEYCWKLGNLMIVAWCELDSLDKSKAEEVFERTLRELREIWTEGRTDEVEE